MSASKIVVGALVGGTGVITAASALGRGAGAAVGALVAATTGACVATTSARCVGVAEGAGAEVAGASVGVGRGEGRGVACGVACGDGSRLGVADATGDASGSGEPGIGVGTSGNVKGVGDEVASASVCDVEPRLPITENAAPITNPKITIATSTGTNGRVEFPLAGFGRDRRGGVSPIDSMVSRQEETMLAAKRTHVIRVPIPIDVGTVAQTACEAFALATPVRVERLLALAVGEAIGTRAPGDKRERSIRATIAGFAAGAFVVDIDGTIYRRLDDVVLCAGVATLRFFKIGAARTRAPRD